MDGVMESVMSINESENFFTKGLKALDDGMTITALVQFERALQIDSKPIYSSYFAFCVAKERGLINKAITICTEAIEKDPENSGHYLNLGKIYLLSGRVPEAESVFREGLHHEMNAAILAELDKLEVRKAPVFSMLHRDHPLNKYVGLVLKRVGLR